MAAHFSMGLGAVLAAGLDLRYLLYWLLSLWLLPGCLWLLARPRMRLAAAHCEHALALGGGVWMLCALLLQRHGPYGRRLPVRRDVRTA